MTLELTEGQVDALKTALRNLELDLITTLENDGSRDLKDIARADLNLVRGIITTLNEQNT